MDQKKLAYFKERLLDLKKETEDRLQTRYNLEEGMIDAIRELSMYDNHPGDIGTELFEREKDLSLYSLDRETQKEIDQALDKIKNGTYGLCTVCGQPIPDARLEALPQAMTCKEHAPTQYVDQSRPIEEEFLKPPFGRSSLDERDDANFFDGEDAWQIVQGWGSSDTPFTFQEDKTDYKEMYHESDEHDGFVQDVEQIGYTGIDGYHGPDSVRFVRSGTYMEYLRKNEGYGNFMDYENYLEERAEQAGRDDTQ